MSIWTVFGVIIGALIGTGIMVWMDIIIHVTRGIFERSRCENAIWKGI